MSIFVAAELPLVRVLKCLRLCVVQIELSDLKRFNMMSQQLSAAFGLARLSWNELWNLPDVSTTLNIGGVGLHLRSSSYIQKRSSIDLFCSITAGAPYLLYRLFVSGRSFLLHRTCVLYGVLVGGGVALAMHAHVRLGFAACTCSFGNLSRGAVPGMLLSQTLPRACG